MPQISSFNSQSQAAARLLVLGSDDKDPVVLAREAFWQTMVSGARACHPGGICPTKMRVDL